MVKECRIDVGLCKKDPPKTHGTRESCETGTGLGGHGHRANCANSQVYCVLCVVSVLRYLS